MRGAVLYAVLIGLAGCKRAASTPAPAASVTVAAAPAVDAGAKRPVLSDKPPFLHAAPLPAGPVVVKGYPHNIANGMNEYADHFGFSADSALLVYEWEMGGVGGTDVEILAKDGSKRSMQNARSGDDKPDPAFDKKEREIEKFIADEKIEALPKATRPGGDGPGPTQLGPPLKGTWRFTDITLDVRLIDASGASANTGPTHPAHVQVGGLVAGEKQACIRSRSRRIRSRKRRRTSRR